MRELLEAINKLTDDLDASVAKAHPCIDIESFKEYYTDNIRKVLNLLAEPDRLLEIEIRDIKKERIKELERLGHLPKERGILSDGINEGTGTFSI